MRFIHIAALVLTLPLLPTASVAQQAAAPALATPTATLAISLTGVEEHKGAILVALFDQADWSGGKSVSVAMADAAGPVPVATIAGLSAGRDGMKGFHDLDGDEKMGANPFGVPPEPFAFSNNAVGQRGVPRWEAASLEVRRQWVSRMRGFRHWRWYLNDMYVKLNGEMEYLGRAVDHEGEVLESYVMDTVTRVPLSPS